MVKANEKWAACMLEKGYRYEEPDEIDSDLEERFKAIVGAGVAPGTSTTPAGRELRPRRAHRAAARGGADRERRPRLREAGDRAGRAGGPPAVRGAVPQAEPAAAGARAAAGAEPVRRLDEIAGWLRSLAALMTLALPLALGACGGEEESKADDAKARTAVHTDFDPANFSDSTKIDNQYLAARAGDAVHLRGPLQPRRGPPAAPGHLHGHGPDQGDRRRDER